MINNLLKNIELSKTAFHAVLVAEEILKKNGFHRLEENAEFKVKRGGKYYTTRADSSLNAYTIGKENY
jgi:aspartyl aminopeptidase